MPTLIDRLSFERELLAARPEVVKFVKRLMRYSDSAADRDDVVSDVMFLALRSWKHYTGGMVPWLMTITRHRFYRLCTKERRRRELRERHRAEVRQALHSSAYGASVATSRDFARFSLSDESTAALEKLAPHYRQVLEATVFDEKSSSEVCSELGIAVGTRMSRLHRARQALAEDLAPLARSYGIKSDTVIRRRKSA